ncbi:MAG: Cullin-3 [Caeruleum heppii]|nr:MAG: Cullin-3 [Caeruleum heppii]
MDPLQALTSSIDGNVDFETMWGVLASSLSEIHTKNASKLSFEELYRNAYKIVLRKKGDVLYERVKQFEHTWLSETVRPRLRALLSPSVLPDTATTTDNEKRVAGERFMRGLKQAWEDHNLCMNMTTDVLMYMDRVYCTDNHKPSIFTAAMGIFREVILNAPLDPSKDLHFPSALRMLNLIINDQIEMDRNGDQIDKALIRSCIYMLEGLYETDEENETEKLYLTSFEPEFLKLSQEFYEREGLRLLRDCDAPRYLQRTHQRMVEESDRCRSTISSSTTPAIHSVVEEKLIEGHLSEVADKEGSGLRYMLVNDRYEDLALFYQLNSFVDEKKSVLGEHLKNRVVAAGQEINQAAMASTSATAVPQGDGEKDAESASKPTMTGAANLQTAAAIKWVDDVLQLKDKYESIWKRAFESDQGLQTSLTRSLSEFINSFGRSSEYISLFIDENLKRGLKGKTEGEVDAVLDKAIVLLRYVQDKDLFERYYKKHLSRRLLMGRSVSGEVEKQMISRMKLEVGNHFTQKLEGMFKDMAVSEDLTGAFKKRMASDTERIELGVSVLTSTFWPLESMGPSASEEGGAPCVFPPAIEQIKKGFEGFYYGKHTGRKLTWQASMGTADVRAVFPKVPGKEGMMGRERRHELNVSTYAMVVLLLFNDLPSGASLTFEEIQAKTMIPANELVRNLQSLAVAPKTRVLIKEPMSKDVKPTDRFSFNAGFSSKFLKIKVGVVAGVNRVEGDRERRDTERRNDEMRGGAIEAAIVRIMKQRKELPHQNLLGEVIAQLSPRFLPDVNMVKRKIEILIEREYLERVGGVGVQGDGGGGRRAAYRYMA